jgi:hypothetical protein
VYDVCRGSFTKRFKSKMERIGDFALSRTFEML